MPRGLVKAKKYDWKDSNLAMFGSDTEKEVKKESAEQEPAWQGAGQAPGLKIWRIEAFEIKDWPEEDYGEFYNGDSYIILNTFKDEESEELNYDVHFWIGKNSTQDEYGTAAYKTVELDTLLDDKPVQHREVQGHESALFKSYFPKGIQTMEGGAASGFRSVPAEEYEARLLHFAKDKKNHICVREIPRARSLVSSGDVYILDAGMKIYQFNGSSSSPMERSKAMQYIGDLKSKRGEAESEVLDEDSTSTSHAFFEALNEEPDEDGNASDDEDEDGDKKLCRVNTDTRDFEDVKEGQVTLDDFKSDDVFIYDSGETVFVWVGSNASPAEKKNGLPIAHNYLRQSGQPWRSVAVLREGTKSEQFTAALAA
ncbi:gelsolin-like protein 2 isoform X2 [Littorina saxatilis]|uniref:gelsolin-like protein 2 isoform X2 n=1 Tax=Littorina saxatilis TaxID=31220 RepID=UPI0038B419E2